MAESNSGSWPRTTPMSLGALGERLGMSSDFEALGALEARGAHAAVIEELERVLPRLETREIAAADVHEMLGQLHTKCSGNKEPAASRAAARQSVAGCWERCLDIRLRHLGTAHPDTVWIRHVLAMWYSFYGGPDGRALSLSEENVRCQPAGPVDPGFELQERSLLAHELRQAGRSQDAIGQLERVVQVLAADKQSEPSDRARSVAMLASACMAAGRLQEGRNGYDQALKQLEACLPASAGKLAQSAYTYAVDLGRIGELDDAELSYQLHVVVSLRHGMIPMGRPHRRPSTDLEAASEAIWSRFPPAGEPHGGSAHRGAVAAGSARPGLWSRFLAMLKSLVG